MLGIFRLSQLLVAGAAAVALALFGFFAASPSASPRTGGHVTAAQLGAFNGFDLS
jgi:hypothetical protein